MSVMQYMGIVTGYIAGTFVRYDYIPYIMLPISVLFFIFMFHVPDTPYYLFQANKIEVHIITQQPFISIVNT